eukprot:jgi/Mesen1/8160/ME000438S07262
MNYEFSNLLGAPYRGGNVLLHSDTQLLTPVGNRVNVIDLENSETVTLPFENGVNISRIALSPNGVLLLSVDEQGRALLVNAKRRVVLHHFSFKGPVSALEFSPDGKYFAAGVGRLVQIWHTPGVGKLFSPFQLHRTYAGCHDTVTCLGWSPDGRWIAAGSKDLTVRVFSFEALQGYKPASLTGHRDSVVGVYFVQNPKTSIPGGEGSDYGVYSVSKDGALFAWSFQGDEAGGDSTGTAALSLRLDEGKWELREKHFFKQGGGAKLTACAYHGGLGLLIWNVASGFCFVTMSEHTMPLTGVAFLPSGGAVLSSSLDGTVRAFDLLRYRNFRTFTSPTPTQLGALAVHPSGEIVCAASLDNFQVYVWSVKTGRLLDILSGHEGPVCCLAFSAVQETLASGSWDKTVRIWDVFGGKSSVESLPHTHDVLALAFRPDGKQVASATLDGQINFWDPIEGELQGSIEGRRDVTGGRLAGDRQTAGNSSAGKAFHSLAYSADGAFLLAAGSSKFICCYDVAERVLLRRITVSDNRSLDGVLDTLNSKRMTDAGPLDLLDPVDSDDDDDGKQVQGGGLGMNLPGAGKGRKAQIRTKCVRISPTGQGWAAATTAGVLMYALDEGLVFDPTDLDEDVTPQSRRFAQALLLALRLNEPALVRRAVEAVPPGGIAGVVQVVPRGRLGNLLATLAQYLEQSPHVEFLLRWCQEVFVIHGKSLGAHSVKSLLPSLRGLQKGLTRLHDDLAQSCASNQYLLQYLTSVPQAEAERGGAEQGEHDEEGSGEGEEEEEEREDELQELREDVKKVKAEESIKGERKKRRLGVVVGS